MTITVADLDKYRAGYQAGMTLQQHQAFYHRLAQEYPEQNYWDERQAREFLGFVKPATVVELGGWDGALAAAMLKHDKMIRQWDNWELADIPQVCDDPRYRFRLENEWIWQRPILGDCFIASHSLEHLTEEHLDNLLWTLCCRFAYVDVPLFDVGWDWHGTTTTHILPLSIKEFDAKWEAAGWTILRAEQSPGGVPSHVRFMRWGNP